MSRLFSKSQRKELYRRAGGQCEAIGSRYGLPEGVRCMNMLGSTWHADHDLLHDSGGVTEIENGRALCLSCHGYKTAKHDIPTSAKNRRVREKATGIRRTSNPMPGSRASGWRRKMDGTVERR